MRAVEVRTDGRDRVLREQRGPGRAATSPSPTAGIRARCARRPGVVGPRAAAQACRRSARRAEGFVALAPDLYHGELAEHTEMDKAAQLMNALPIDRAARDMAGAIDYLLAQPGGDERHGRRDRLLHGRHAHAGHRRAAGRPDRRRRAVLRRAARRRDARLVGAHRARARPLRRERRLLPARRRRASSRSSCRAWARTSASSTSPTPATRSRTRRTRSAPTTPTPRPKTWTHSVEWLRRQLG